jgi:glycosyltransferase involved in cell wall biosynthesis
MKYIHQMLMSNELGGAGLIALNLARFFSTQTQKCRVWIPGDGPARCKADELGLAYSMFDCAGPFGSSKARAAWGNWRIGLALRHYVPGIIHLYSSLHYGALHLGIQMSGLRSVVHIQLEEESGGLSWAFKSPPDLVITCANFLVEQVRNALPAHLQETQLIVSVPNAVDTMRFLPGDKILAKKRIGVADKIPLILMVANLAPHKGQETVIRAAAMLKEMGVNPLFWLVGTERGGTQEYTSRLRSLCCELGVAEQVYFLGQRDDIPDLLRAADAFLLPSTAEGLPLSVLEAQATKVPVIAAPTAGVPEVVIDGETGFLMKAHDVEGYAHCIRRLLGDRMLYTHLTERAYAKIVKEHTWNVYVEQIQKAYLSLIQSGRQE